MCIAGFRTMQCQTSVLEAAVNLLLLKNKYL